MMKKIGLLLLAIVSLLFVGIYSSPHVFAAEDDVNFEVSVVSPEGTSTTNFLSPYGSQTNVSFALPGYAYHIYNGTVSDQTSRQFLNSRSTFVVMVINDTEDPSAVYVDTNGQILQAKYGESLDFNGDEPTKPGFIFEGFVEIATVATVNKVYRANYSVNPEANTPTVLTSDGVTLSNNLPAYNEVITATGNGADGYWVENGAIIAYGNEYVFSAVGARELTFVVDANVDHEPVVSFVDVSGIRPDHDSYLGQVYLPTGYELIEYGFLFSEERALLDLENADLVLESTALAHTNEFLRSVDSEWNFESVRAYAKVKDSEGVITPIYSQRNLGFATDLFISEYIEGSSNNKAIEIANFTGQTIDLSQYKLELYANGATNATSTEGLIGTLDHGSVLVVVNSQADSEFKISGSITSGVAGFNGNDAIALVKNEYLLDVFGVIGEDPGTNWAVPGGDTLDNTLVRKIGIYNPTITWKPTEWDVYPNNTSTHLGNHILHELSDSEKVDLAKVELENQMGDNLELTSNINLPTAGAYETNIDWSSSNEGIISNEGEVNRPTFEEGDSEVTLTFTISLGIQSRQGQIQVTVKAIPEVTEEGKLIIFEAYGGGGNSGATYKHDFIVLYNGTSSPINLNGYSVQYASATGTSWQVTNLSGTINSGGYYIIRQAAGSGGSLELPQIDVIGSIPMGGTNFKVALVNSTTQLTGGNPTSNPTVIDFLGTGTANASEGQTATAGSNTSSVRRKIENGMPVDTDNNSTDFEVISQTSFFDYL